MITAILEFFALGTIGFWILCSLLSIVFIACIENETHWFPTCALIALGAIYWKPLVALGLAWQGLAIGALVYVVAGMIWSIYRWYRFVKETADKYRQQYGNTLTDSNRSSLKSDISVSSNKALITGWIAYWPWSLVWNITGDFFKTAYEKLQKVYQGITDKALSGFGSADENRGNATDVRRTR
jgi:hypothetical protein